MTEDADFSWIEESERVDAELAPYLEDVPSGVRILYIYTNENYNIGKVRKEVMDIKDGVVRKADIKNAIVSNRTHDGVNYRYATSFYYFIHCTASHVLEYGENRVSSLDSTLRSLPILDDIRVPSCAKMIQSLNTIYVIFQRLRPSSTKNTTRKVRFDTSQSSRKTRRL
jgi:hypothetical protein